MAELTIKSKGTEYICRSFFDINDNGGIGGVEVSEVVPNELPVLLGQIENFELPDETDEEELELFEMKIGVWLNENEF